MRVGGGGQTVTKHRLAEICSYISIVKQPTISVDCSYADWQLVLSRGAEGGSFSSGLQGDTIRIKPGIFCVE